MAQRGNVKGIKYLFIHGQASPYDVEENGFSALWFTLDTPIPSMLELCKLILAEGADPHEHVTSRHEHLSSFGTVWELILGRVVDEDTAQALKLMFNDPDRLNELHFTDRHQQVLGLPAYESDNLHEMSEQDIDTLDDMGRTALHWSVLCNDIVTTHDLLKIGANPNKSAERSGWASMHFTACAVKLDSEIIALFLKCGADVNSRDCHLQTPLSRAVRHGAEATKLLIDAGVDVNLHYDEARWYALHLAILIGKADCVEVLLDAGADPSLRTVTGESIHCAQDYGTIEVLEVLSRFRALIRPAFRQHGLGFTRKELGAFYFERNLSLVTEEWWSAWNRLTDNFCRPNSSRSSVLQVDDDSYQYDSDEGVEVFEDAMENLDRSTSF